jgi:hypothetical protein
MGHCLELILSMNAEIRALWKVLAQQPVGVFVATALPGAFWVTEVDVDPGFRF